MMAELWWQWLGLWFSAFSSATILPGTSDVVLVCSISFVLCLVAAFVPAFLAARVDPAVALRD